MEGKGKGKRAVREVRGERTCRGEEKRGKRRIGRGDGEWKAVKWGNGEKEWERMKRRGGRR